MSLEPLLDLVELDILFPVANARLLRVAGTALQLLGRVLHIFYFLN